jgi:hypothetical protein
MTVAPVLVTVEPPRTAKLEAVPNPGATAANERAKTLYVKYVIERDKNRTKEILNTLGLCILFELLSKNICTKQKL